MKSLRVVALAVLVAVATPVAAEQTSRLIVKLKPSSAGFPATSRLARLSEDVGVALRPIRTMATGAQVVGLDAPVDVEQAERTAARIAAHPDVEYAEPDRRVHALRSANDEFITGQGYLTNGNASISAYSAWDVTTGSPNTVVAVIDTGIRPHADLAGRILPGYDMISDPVTANDGDGRDADASDPGDWVASGEGCAAHNSTWHGTSVAGVIAANTNNGLWTAGIDWNAKILSVRGLGKCGGLSSDIADAIAWAAGLQVPGVPANPTPAQVINLSLGGTHPCGQTYQAAIDAAFAVGVTRAIVVAAGNESTDASTSAPANCAGVISVASTTSIGKLAAYSNFGPTVTVSAPGGQPSFSQFLQGIVVLSNAGATTPTSDSFANEGGTSFAAPMVAGTVSLMLAVAPGLSAQQVHDIVVSTAKPFPAGSDCTPPTCGPGIVDAGSAVRAAQALAASAPNYEGLWWDGAENGWGINLAHQGDQIYLTWYTYDANGKASWLAMLAQKSAPGTYSGTIFEAHGPAFNANPFAPVPSLANVGNGTLTFSDTNNGTFSYSAKGVNAVKAITRFPFAAPPPTCAYTGAPDFAAATNYQDLWWDSAESGWGINLVHQGAQIYATWYTYDTDGSPLWFDALMAQTAPATFSGTLYRVSGSPFGASWNPSLVVSTGVGMATLVFANGNAATWSYTVGAIAGSRPITRTLFASPAGTVCH